MTKYSTAKIEMDRMIALPIFLRGFTISDPLFVIVVKPLKLRRLKAIEAIKAVAVWSGALCSTPSREKFDTLNAAREKIVIPAIFMKEAMDVKV